MQDKEMKGKSAATPVAGGDSGKGKAFAAKKSEMDKFAAAGDDAINSSLSLDPEKYLSNNRQAGGQ